MAYEEEKAIEKNHETTVPAGAKTDELSEEDIANVAAGLSLTKVRCDLLKMAAKNSQSAPPAEKTPKP